MVFEDHAAMMESALSLWRDLGGGLDDDGPSIRLTLFGGSNNHGFVVNDAECRVAFSVAMDGFKCNHVGPEPSAVLAAHAFVLEMDKRIAALALEREKVVSVMETINGSKS